MKLPGKAIAPGVDLKPEGHCVACPPSVVDGAKYEVVSDGTAVATLQIEIVRALLTAGEQSTDDTKSATTIGDFVESKGGRKNALVSAAGHLSRVPAYLAEPMLRGLNEELPGGPLSKRDVDEVQKSRANWAVEQTSLDPADWPVPKPIQVELPPAMECDPFALLPRALAEYVVEESEMAGHAPDGLVVSLAICAGGLVSPTILGQQKEHDESWVVSTSMAGGLISDSGSKKSTAIKPPKRFLRAIEKRDKEALLPMRQEWRAKQLVAEARQTRLKNSLKTATEAQNDGAALVAARELAAVEVEVKGAEPCDPLYVVDTTTIEALVQQFTKQKHGAVLFNDELSTLFAVTDKQGSQGSLEFFMSAIDAEDSYSSLRVNRGREGTTPALSIIGTATGDKWKRVMNSVLKQHGSNGALQRFQMLVYPNPRRYPLVDRPRKNDRRAVVADLFDYLAALDPSAIGAVERGPAPRGPSIKFSTAAQVVRTRWHTQLETERIPATQIDNKLLGEHLSKFPRTYGSIALTLHLLERRKGPIQVDTAEMAVRWCDYLESHARRIYALLDGEEVGAAGKIARKLREGKLLSGFTAKDVYQNGYGGCRNVNEATPALNVLVELGHLRQYVTGDPNGGPRSLHYDVNPRIKVVAAQAVAPIAASPPAPRKRGRSVVVNGVDVLVKRRVAIPKKPRS